MFIVCNFSRFSHVLRNKTLIATSSYSVLKTNRPLDRISIERSQFRFNSTSVAHHPKDWFSSLLETETVGVVRDSLITIHDTAGLTWGGTILLTTFGIRLALTLPAGVYQNYIISKLELCKLEFGDVVKDLKRETVQAINKFGWTDKQARRVYNYSVKKQWRLLIERNNCHPLKTSIVLWVQIPVWVILSLAMRSMTFGIGSDPTNVARVTLELSNEGLLWFPNLLAIDHLHILPVIVCLSNLAIIELQWASKDNHTRAQRIITNVIRGFAVLSFPITCYAPCCLAFYWCWSSSLALCQNLLLMSPRFREICKIPPSSRDKDRPYHYAWTNFSSRWRSIGKPKEV